MSFERRRGRSRAAAPRTVTLGSVNRQARGRGGRPPRNGLWVALVVAGLAVIASATFVFQLHRAPSAAHRAVTPARHVVVFVLEGYGADDLATVAMPHLHSLRSSGVSFSNAFLGFAPAISPVAGAVLGTGSPPSDTGIVGSEWTGPTGATIHATDAGAVRLGALDAVLEARGPQTLAGLIKEHRPRSTILAVGGEPCADAAAAAGWEADYVLCSARSGSRWLPTSVAGHALPPGTIAPSRLAVPVVTARRGEYSAPGWPLGGEDRAVANYAVAALRTLRPAVTVVAFPEMAQVAASVPPARRSGIARQLLSGIDTDIGRLEGQLRATGQWRSTAVVVTSGEVDTPVTASVSRARLAQAVVAAGGQMRYLEGDGAAFIGLASPGQAGPVAQALEAAHIPGVDAILYKVRRHGRWAYSMPFVDPLLPQGVAQFYGTEANAVAASNSADDIAVLAPGAGIAGSRGGISVRSGGFQWNQQHIPLVFAGPDVGRGTSTVAARLENVAPTIAGLLGLPNALFPASALPHVLAGMQPVESNLLRSRLARLQPAVGAAKKRMSVIG